MVKAYFPLYTGDYLRDTRDLTAGQHGAYMLILMHLWDNDGWMENRPKLIQVVTNWTRDEYRRGWPKIERFFVIHDGRISHKRITLELEKRAKSVSKLRQSGAKGGRKTQQKQRALQAFAKGSQVKDLTSVPYGTETSSLSDDRKSAQAVSPPSPEMGGGDTPASEELKPLRLWLQSRVQGLMVAHVLSARDVRDLKDALRGGSEECVLLSPRYTPPEHVAKALESICIEWANMPALKAIEGGKS